MATGQAIVCHIVMREAAAGPRQTRCETAILSVAPLPVNSCAPRANKKLQANGSLTDTDDYRRTRGVGDACLRSGEGAKALRLTGIKIAAERTAGLVNDDSGAWVSFAKVDLGSGAATGVGAIQAMTL
jgi:hypothetical protein